MRKEEMARNCEKSVTISRKYKYLSEYPEFKKNGLPVGYLIDKGKVGCGGTTIALENDINTIICVPFVSLIKNKLDKYKNNKRRKILGVYEGITDKEVIEYNERKSKCKKIICTYDSLPRVARLVGFDYFLLIDELHLLFTNYSFRNKAIRGVLDIFNKFNTGLL